METKNETEKTGLDAKIQVEIPEGMTIGEDHQVTGDINADVLSYVRLKGIITEDHINLPYSTGQIHASISFLKGQGKLNSDGTRIWI
jgi:hypothetical protein